MRYGVSIVVQMDEDVHGGTFSVVRGTSANAPAAVETKAIQMLPTEAPAADEEEAATETDEKRSQRRKRRRRRGGRGEGSNEAGYQNGAATLETGDGEEGSDAEDAPEENMAAGSADEPGTDEESATRNGGAEGDQEFRRNRRRGRRGGRRHRDEPGGAELSKQRGEAIPGLGEQPDLNFDLHFPKSTVLGPVSREPALHEQTSGAQTEVQVLIAAVEPELSQPVVDTGVAGLSEAAPEPAFEAPVAVEEPAAVAPVQAPKPKPVRTGPPRKGWWQRQTG